ncbi:MAG: thymidylate synthase (FAD) [Euryarchaeota archaeon]|nr:thymidylate synthase (FAD) [Euryarchaeota archaeon]|tara:strand:+ start:1674 stop:2381 length:708 start_codon:yes stop_codon:yes gene_type:complete
MTKVCLVSVTPDAEKTIGYVARVSNPNNQDNPKVDKLLAYCIKHGHWSIFEQAHMTLEINTTRGIAAQILRHRSFTFQEFSQRYADTNLLDQPEVPDLRRQDDKNRQNSIDDIAETEKAYLQGRISQYFKEGMDLYNDLLSKGIAKECARFVLPLATPTRIYMTGSARSWMHYIQLRTANGTQKEHMDIANLCRDHFICNFPTIAKALDWCPQVEDDCDCRYDGWDDLQPCLRID